MKRLRQLAVLAVVAASLGSSATATAATAPGFELFANCPDRTVNPSTTLCFTAEIDGGYTRIGSKVVPVLEPMTLSGGALPSGGFVLGGLEGGRQPFPGGLAALIGVDRIGKVVATGHGRAGGNNRLEWLLKKLTARANGDKRGDDLARWLGKKLPANLLDVSAKTELAGVPGGPLSLPLSLPIKIKYEGPLLSDDCYIGSNSEPIALNVTTGSTAPPPPNQPIVGSNGELWTSPLGILGFDDRVLVDNSFAVPAASGCELVLPGIRIDVDELIDREVGLPSPAGHNETVQIAQAAFAPVMAVYPPAGIEQ